ncbi:PadR family transcriptional regulator [Agromyces seonyuensis]|uniref:PadR family transcriptional regulator n=1 Tax=Agromyces seonyuensis TaxID=2662446 RepID=A0A6I4P2B5_9MICO|nr:PadR family transcriptional regulator [Agromyces seonyuensis]MWB97417.1 PadR family transcriptional regulator [Agromyces seonyuensis]
MNTQGNDTGGAFGGPRGFGGDGGLGGANLWDALQGLRDTFEQKVGPRMGRGDVRTAILALLAVEPMHGYQLIHAIEERTGGLWKPSPGSVYPTLQLLADEGLVTAEEANGKKVYSLTDSGREAADAAADSAPWASPAMADARRSGELPKAGMKLAQAVAQVARGGTPEQAEQAVAVLDEARRKLYSILAQD